MSWQVFLVLCFFLFFLLGILVANGVGRIQLLQYGKINDYYVNQLAYLEIQPQEYFFYLLGNRSKLFAAIVLLGFTWLGMPAFFILLGWHGFCLGYLFVNALVGMGLQGMCFLLASFFPQLLCYIPAYFWLMRSMLENGHNRFRLFGVHTVSKHACWKHLFFSLMLFAAGIWLESWLNPVLVQMIVRKIV